MRRFYAPAPEGSDSPTEIIVIMQGEQGYAPMITDIDQEVADRLNELNGTTQAEVEAAILCSMFNCWQNFDKITATNQERQS